MYLADKDTCFVCRVLDGNTLNGNKLLISCAIHVVSHCGRIPSSFDPLALCIKYVFHPEVSEDSILLIIKLLNKLIWIRNLSL